MIRTKPNNMICILVVSGLFGECVGDFLRRIEFIENLANHRRLNYDETCHVSSPMMFAYFHNVVRPSGVPRQQSRLPLRSVEHKEEHHHAEAAKRIDE